MKKLFLQMKPHHFLLSFLLLVALLKINLEELFYFYKNTSTAQVIPKFLHLPGLMFEDIVFTAILGIIIYFIHWYIVVLLFKLLLFGEIAYLIVIKT